MRPEIKVYNSLARRKEALPEAKKLRLFVCGPTVYDDSHIGHARTYIFFDFFVKYLRHLGYKIKYVQNITNIDDKIIARAKETDEDPLKLAGKFTKRYFEDMESLGVNAVDKYAPATKFIKQIVRQIRALIEKGFAYEIAGDGWYYDVSKFADYGKLSGRTITQAEDGVSRIDESVGKRNRADFCLWKYSKPGEPTWKSSLGEGRPGWHIEDTAISEYYFGTQYEIHGGGLDLKFPHHEAEIAQQEAASGASPFVKLWMHTGFLTVNGEKMSKSLGNFITIGDCLEKTSPEILRLAFFSHHYRSPADYNDKLIEDSAQSLDRIKEFFGKLDFAKKIGGSKNIEKEVSGYEQKFHSAVADDINTPSAVASIFELINTVNPSIYELDKKSSVAAKNYIERAFGLLGIRFKSPKIPTGISKMANEREQFRTNKQFAQSDDLRKKINDLGYVVEDTPVGPFIWPARDTKNH